MNNNYILATPHPHIREYAHKLHIPASAWPPLVMTAKLVKLVKEVNRVNLVNLLRLVWDLLLTTETIV